MKSPPGGRATAVSVPGETSPAPIYPDLEKILVRKKTRLFQGFAMSMPLEKGVKDSRVQGIEKWLLLRVVSDLSQKFKYLWL
jgi:hypothetical protein